ncbi:MAG: UDP-N-acetylglucosamine 2-epimerase (non-hydrolyzing) [Casimicrobiaceae bacterium]
MIPAVVRLTSLQGDVPETARLRADPMRVRAINAAHVHAAPPRKTILVVAGTRPECIKLVPVLRALAHHPDLSTLLVNSGQHLRAVRDALAEFDVCADVEMAELQSLPSLSAAHEHLRRELRGVMRRVRPDLVMVQGDTLSAYSGARAARDTGCAIAHVEAGLRTDALLEPFPEEWFRRQIARYADLHFAPSRVAAENLFSEGYDSRSVHNVGNTAIDSLRRQLEETRHVVRRERRPRATVLVTLHRRGNFDRNAATVCAALLDLVAARPGLRVLFPVHPNPRISATVRRHLGAHPAFDLVEPMRYDDFIGSASRAALIISDSGGIQEEAPHLGTPLLVPRPNTERPECLATGFVQLVAVDRDALVRAALSALDAPRRAPLPIDSAAPYGVGDAAIRIRGVLESLMVAQVHA